jgi:beta-N-acetylhexosaminidase
LPTTLSRAVMTDLLRRDLGFEGVTISDALDMRALAQGPDQVVDVVAAIRAGVDLLLASADPEALERIEHTLIRAADRELFDAEEVAATERRLDSLRGWLESSSPQPDLSIVRGTEHIGLAAELALRSVTLVANPARLLPIRRGTVGRVLAVMPRPTDLTPADTSSTVQAALGAALRRYHADVDEVVVEPEPDAASIAAIRDRAAAADRVVIGTIDAHRLTSQLVLVEAVAATGTPTIAVAMRGPWDVALYPAGVTALASYSILPTSLEVVAAVIAGMAVIRGKLPVRVPVPA